MPFKPGQSGNPGGRPKGSGYSQRCREFSEKHGLKFLEDLVLGKIKGADLALRARAAMDLADRGFGKPPQSVEHNGGDVPIRFTLSLGE